MKFHELREHAKDWLDSGRKAKRTAMQEEHTTSSEFQELKQLIQAQQQMLDELSKGKHKANTYQQEAQPEAHEPLTCNYCGGLNHFKRNCIQFQKDNGTFGRIEEVFMEEAEVEVTSTIEVEVKEVLTMVIEAEVTSEVEVDHTQVKDKPTK